MTPGFDMLQPLLSAGTYHPVFLQVFFTQWLLFPNCTNGTKPIYSQTSFQTVLRLWSGSGGPSCSHRAGPELSLSAAVDARDAAPFPADCQHNHKVLVVGRTENVSSVDPIWPSNIFLLLFCRTYRGFNLSNTVADVTLENNLSRVITAVSRALTSSTSRAVTVSPQPIFPPHEWKASVFLLVFRMLHMSILVFTPLLSSLAAVKHCASWL